MMNGVLEMALWILYREWIWGWQDWQLGDQLNDFAMIQEGYDIALIWVVVMNVVKVAKFEIYLKAYLTEFVDRLDGKYERVVDYSKIVGLGHKANDGSIFWNWKQFQIKEVEVRKEEVWSNLKILCI